MSGQLSTKELSLILDTDFLLAKVKVTEKINDLLSETRKNLHSHLLKEKFSFPVSTALKDGKIFRGENYLHLPYVLLDYPRHFSKESVFAVRTMFWWGNEFSCTLHLQGSSLKQYRKNLLKNSNKLLKTDIYLCVNTTPWQYHFKKDNYIPAKSLTKKEITQILSSRDFIKLSRKTPLKNWKTLPAFAEESLIQYEQLLS